MRELYELRVNEDFAPQMFADGEGKQLGSIRLVTLGRDDPRLPQIRALQESTRRKHNRRFFLGWDIIRKYTKAELDDADILKIDVRKAFEPAGEECGTMYDESAACPVCRSGAPQTSPLYLDLKRIPQGRDFSRTIAGEIIVSRRVVEAFQRQGLRGAEFGPVLQSPKSSAISSEWFQLRPKSVIEIVPPTQTGAELFDNDPQGRFRCPRGDLIGLNLQSEVWVRRDGYDGSDIVASKQFIGARRGLLRPQRELFASRHLRRVITDQPLKGIKFEVAHFV